MHDAPFRTSSEADGRALLAAAAIDWARPVPHCPEWDAAALVHHMGSILAWMAGTVSTGERVSWRTIEPAPDDVAELPDWFLGRLQRTLEVFATADPAAPTWTFSSTGDHRAGWWDRRLAVEIGTHRWDAQYAQDKVAAPLAVEVATAGLEEFMVEFLPGLLAQEDVDGLTGTLHLHATDGPAEWFLDLDAGTAVAQHAKADTAVRATTSDLLLWLNNRGPLPGLEILGDADVVSRWVQLRR
jgi:uncharacterized protein (TIGR03083 family)